MHGIEWGPKEAANRSRLRMFNANSRTFRHSESVPFHDRILPSALPVTVSVWLLQSRRGRIHERGWGAVELSAANVCACCVTSSAKARKSIAARERVSNA